MCILMCMACVHRNVLTVAHLRKYLAKKMGLGPEVPIELWCRNEVRRHVHGARMARAYGARVWHAHGARVWHVHGMRMACAWCRNEVLVTQRTHREQTHHARARAAPTGPCVCMCMPQVLDTQMNLEQIYRNVWQVRARAMHMPRTCVYTRCACHTHATCGRWTMRTSCQPFPPSLAPSYHPLASPLPYHPLQVDDEDLVLHFQVK